MKKELCIILILIFAIAIRLYPAATSGMPFSTDAWPLIRNTELIIQNTPIPLNSGIFDAYNNFWPGIQLFGATLSQTTNLPPITAMALGIPIVAAFATLIFYFLVKRLTANAKTSLFASAMLAAAFSYTLYTSGVTKEAFASPLYFTLILLFLLKHNKKTLLAFSLASITLALTHHFTAFFATVILTALSIASYTSKEQKTNSNTSNLLLIGIQSTITLLYFGLFASPKFNSNFTSNTMLTVAAYQILAIALTLGFVHNSKRHSTRRTFIQFILGSLVAIEIMLIILNVCTLPEARILYALPLIIGLPVAIFGLNGLYQKKTSLMLPLFWLISVLAFTGFTVFANTPGGSDFTWRSMNFIIPPLIILTAIGLHKIYAHQKHVKIRRLSKTFSVIAIIAIISINAYGMYQTVSEQNSSLGYFWLYHPSDYKAAGWIATNAYNQTTGGDAKVSYLLQEYYNKSVSNSQGLSYLEGKGSAPELLYIYNSMFEEGKGYVLGGVPISLPANWTDKLSNYNCIYANSEVTVYARK